MKSLINNLKNIKENLTQVVDKYFPNYRRQTLFPKELDFSKTPKFSEPEIYFINELIEPGKTVVDVGANIGNYIHCLDISHKHKRIIAFEPIPQLHTRLKALFPKIEISNIALSNSKGKQTFKIPLIKDRQYQTRASLETNKTEENESGSITFDVETNTLDLFLFENNIDDLAFIKIDVEGHEDSVLMGAQNAIKMQRPVLMVEIEQRHHQNKSLNEIFQLVLAYKYCGYFFNQNTNALLSIDDFVLEEHQNFSNLKTSSYHNNFIFVPVEKDLGLEQTNKLIRNKLKI
jgi:FkbM family methyltransferase